MLLPCVAIEGSHCGGQQSDFRRGPRCFVLFRRDSLKKSYMAMLGPRASQMYVILGCIGDF